MSVSLVALVLCAAPAVGQQGTPNILLIMSDDVGQDGLDDGSSLGLHEDMDYGFSEADI